MASPMDTGNYNVVNGNTGMDVKQISARYRNAMQNPRAFEEHIKRTNPQAYDMAMKLARSNNPRDIVMQILNSRGINPSLFNL